MKGRTMSETFETEAQKAVHWFERARHHSERAEAAEARVAELEEAIASALTSLATGPAKDGYAYAVLSEVSAKGQRLD